MQQFPEIKDRPDGMIPTTNVTNELARAVRGLAPVIRTGQVEERPWGGINVKWGKVAVAISGTQSQVTLIPVVGQHDSTATGEPNATVYLSSPPGTAVSNVNLPLNALVAYVPVPSNPAAPTTPLGHVLNVAEGPSGGSSLPTPTAQWQVLQCTAYTSALSYTLAFDWVRAHP
jgi:hypothetical protein